jgi:hypothetical protein
LVSVSVSFLDSRVSISLLRLQLELEARVGIEPTNTAFAEPCLTTWRPRLLFKPISPRPQRKFRFFSFSRIINEVLANSPKRAASFGHNIPSAGCRRMRSDHRAPKSLMIRVHLTRKTGF